tara:strand:- start:1505 stop:1816 length:312 start_codon:yes stop_codon:yes gene_type:complete
MIMHLMFLALESFASDFDRGSYRYKIFDEVIKEKSWIVQASNGLYECTATVRCGELEAGMIIRSKKPTWHDPLTIYYVVDSEVRSCDLKSCLAVQEYIYDYYR